MAVLQKGKALYPFWGASVNLITGLDPLSLQTTSEATYATLLPGISNLTNRLRYYGFYCWLIDLYFQKEKTGNSTEQYRFIRRAELMIAILMQYEKSEVQQITGSDFAANLINNHTGRTFNLEEGADIDDSGKKVYWKYPSGAFGQYYYGAMRALSLIVAYEYSEDSGILFNITQAHPRQKVSGKQLADAFDQTLPADIKKQFYSNIKRGRLGINEIPDLIEYFSIDIINPASPEWNLYVAMLLDKDEPAIETEENFTFHRKESINGLIAFAKANELSYNWQEFLFEAYQNKQGAQTNSVSETMIGWYAYQFNEYFQFANGGILWGVLQKLYGFQQEQYLPLFVDSFSKEICRQLCKELKKCNPHDTIEHLLSLIKMDLEESEVDAAIEKCKNDPVGAASNGFLLLFLVYKRNVEYLHPLKEFMSRKQMIREGNMVSGLLYLHEFRIDRIEDFITQYLLRKIIYRHQMVAMRKMGNGSYSTHKFIIEEQYIRYIDNFPPRGTSPRMNALRNLLYDLGVLDDDSNLTPLHKYLELN